MDINIEKIYSITLKRYEEAEKSLSMRECYFEKSASPISDVIPGFKASDLEFGSYAKENYAVLFVDMRKSTLRAQTVGAEKTFLTMHVYFTALIEVVRYYKGKVIDIMGDGLMVFWGGKEAREKEGQCKSIAIQSAGLCGRDMLRVREAVINPIIEEKKLGPEINIGVGVTFDSVVVTKIGINDQYDVKAFGDCINVASKYANIDKVNKVKVSKKIKDNWPASKSGKMKFESAGADGGYFLVN